MTNPNATCAYTGRELCIRGDSTYPYINLEGHGGIYFADHAAKQRWCQANVREENGRFVPKTPGQVTINGQIVPVATT